jgi:hypothetical protein
MLVILTLGSMYGELFGMLNEAASDKQLPALYTVHCYSHFTHNVDVWIHCMHTLHIIARGVYYFVVQVL